MIGQRRDRTGEPIDPDVPDVEPHWCDQGWVDRDADQLTPCPVCKPHLTRTARGGWRLDRAHIPDPRHGGQQ